MKRMMSATIRGQDYDLEVIVHPADPSVGIASPFVEEFTCLEFDVDVLSEAEIEQVYDQLNQKLADSIDYDDP